MIVLHSKEDEIRKSKEELSRLQRKADTMINQLSEAAKYLREGYSGNPFHVIQIPSCEEVSDLAKQIHRAKTRISELETAGSSTRTISR